MDQARAASVLLYGNKCALPGQRPEISDWDLLRFLHQNSTLVGLRKCHRVRFGPGIQVFAPAGEVRSVTFGGLCRCHSVWACPRCAPAIRRGYAQDLASLLVPWIDGGHGLAFVTNTTRHHRTDSPKAVLKAVTAGWHSIVVDKSVRAWRRSHPFEYSRATEITYGPNGGHPHLHSALAFEEPLSRDDARELSDVLYRPWSSAMERAGFGTPRRDKGVHVVRADGGVSAYMTKVLGLADEMTRLDRKKRGATEQPFDVLRRAYAGDASALITWRDHEQATKGVRSLSFSKNFRSMLGAGVELSEADALELGEGRGPLLGEISGRTADLFARHPRGYEIFLETCSAGTVESFAAAAAMLRGTASWELRDEVEFLHTGEHLPPDLVPAEFVVPDSLADELALDWRERAF